jgi:ribosomal protein S18 acetylase RimI-like enzyme
MSCIYVQTWQDTYLSVVPYGYLSSMSIPQHTRSFFREMKNKQVAGFVAEDAGKVVGFVTGGYERYGNSIYSGEIYTLYVLRSHQRQGVGAKLVTALARGLRNLGIYSVLVQVLSQNPYRHFYKKINGIYLKTEPLTFAGEVLDADYYGWIDASLIYR